MPCSGHRTYSHRQRYAVVLFLAVGCREASFVVEHTFDALDRMVEQNRSSVYTEIVYSATGGKLALMTGQTLKNAFVNLPGKATAVYTSSGLDHYRHADWLGSARLTSSPSQSVLSTTAYAPFGETYAPSGTADPSFTGQNSDTVTGDYDFLAREYSTQGRWSSPDKAGLGAANTGNPQSWNRYAYVLNNPLSITDPTGLDPGSCGNPFEDGGIDCSGGSSPVGQPQLIGNWCSDNTSCQGVWQRDASTPSPMGPPSWIPGLPGGAAPQRPTIKWTDENGNSDSFTGCAGPTGIANVASSCGTQIGDDLKTIPIWYFKELYTQTTITTYTFPIPDLGTFQSLPITIVAPSPWGAISEAFDLQDYATMAFPNLDLSGLQKRWEEAGSNTRRRGSICG